MRIESNEVIEEGKTIKPVGFSLKGSEPKSGGEDGARHEIASRCFQYPHLLQSRVCQLQGYSERQKRWCWRAGPPEDAEKKVGDFVKSLG